MIRVALAQARAAGQQHTDILGALLTEALLRRCWWRWRIGCVEHILPKNARLLLEGNAFR